MATFEDALKEAYAGSTNELVYHCLEITHPSLTQPIRLVQAMENVDAKHEAEASHDAGKVVEYIGAPWQMTLPAIEEGKKPELKLTFDNVSRELTEQLKEASMMNVPILVTYRVYTETTLLDGPQRNPPIVMELSSASADNYTVTANASLEDIHSAAFPSTRFTPQEYPTLAYAT